jgi:hypothetical protein
MLCILCAACNSSDSSTKPTQHIQIPQTQDSTNIPIPENSNSQQYKVLLFGNSHIEGLSEIINLIVATGAPNKHIELRDAASSLYLIDRLSDGVSADILKSAQWTHVIFQAQKYSQSGTVKYPIDGAKKWLQLAKEQKATPILFPEHPQRGNYSEGKMVHDIHLRIVNEESGCLAPIGLTWDKVLALRPTLKLHQADGNHASYTGRVLSSLVFYQVITGNSADLLPYIDNINLDAEIQDFLGQIASQMLAENPACDY